MTRIIITFLIINKRLNGVKYNGYWRNKIKILFN